MTRRDPQATSGRVNYAARPMCICGHSHAMHKLEGRSTCSAATPEKCPCTNYAEEA